MSADIGILQQIQSVFNRLKSASGRVARFSYTEAAFENKNIEGVASYDFNNQQNIPLQNYTDTNTAVLDKGFRSQGASIPRNLQNHFFGRASYNINMVVEQFGVFLNWMFSFIPTVPVSYDAQVTYFPGNIAFLTTTLGNARVITWYIRTSADPDGTVGVPPTDVVRWKILRERTSLSSTIPSGANLINYTESGLYDCVDGTSTIIGLPEREDATKITGAFLLRVESNTGNNAIVTQEITYRDLGRSFMRTLSVIGGNVSVVVNWYKTKEPGWTIVSYPVITIEENIPTENYVGATRGVYKLRVTWRDMEGNETSFVTENLVGPIGPQGFTNLATQETAGLMSNVDKTRVDNMELISAPVAYIESWKLLRWWREYVRDVCVSTWYSKTSASDNGWQSVCWAAELGLFCAVARSGTGNHVMTSPDGINWDTRESAADNEWRSVCWSPELGLFCAVATTGTGNRVMTSPDGITWTARASASDNGWRSVCWSPELGLFCAVAFSGTGNRVMTSPDGITWTARASAADNEWMSVCWSPELGLFCAVAETGTGNRVMTSPNGITWTIRQSAADNNWMSVCWSPELGLFCAVAETGTGNRVMTSPDGITWTAKASAADNVRWMSVCWSPELGLFCAVAETGTGNRVMTSPDGITWTARASAADNRWMSVCWSPELGLFCAVAITGTGNRVMTSLPLGDV